MTLLFAALLSSLSFAAPPAVLSSVALCQGWIVDPAHINLPYGFTVEAYSHSNVVGTSPVDFHDPYSLVTHVHETTNHVLSRYAEGATVTNTVTPAGIVNITVRTQELSQCRDCYTLNVTNAATGTRALVGTIRFAADPNSYTLDCGTL